MKIAFTLMAVVVIALIYVIAKLWTEVERMSYSVSGLRTKCLDLKNSMQLCDNRYDQLCEKIAILTLKLEEIPVDDIAEQARVEKEYLEGIQNIFNYSMADIAKLNKDGI